jgi:uncharacterized protein
MRILLIILLGIYWAIGAFLYIKQREFIYMPTPAIAHPYDVRTFKHDGQILNTTVLNPGKPEAILYFGGNAENVDYNAESFSQLFPNHTVYLVKYRGYGGSSGTPTETGIYADALFIAKTLEKDHANLSVIGRSLGSAVATCVATELELRKLVLITPFDSIQSLAQSRFPMYPMGVLLKDKHDSVSRVDKVLALTLVMAAEHDEIVGMRHTKRLLRAFQIPVLVEVIEHVGHNNMSHNPRFFSVLGEFMNTPS